MLKHICLGLFFVSFIGEVLAQQQEVPGIYNGSKHELAQQLALLPNHIFVFQQSYGARDVFNIGSWRIEGAYIYLKDSTVKKSLVEVYGRHSAGVDTGRRFHFYGVENNRTISFSFGSVFSPKEFRCFYGPTSEALSDKDKQALTVISKPVEEFFIACKYNNSNKDTVFQYHVNNDDNDFVVIYQEPVNDNKPHEELKLKLENNELMIVDADDTLTSGIGSRTDKIMDEVLEAKYMEVINTTYNRMGTYDPFLLQPATSTFSSFIIIDKKTVPYFGGSYKYKGISPSKK
ncbi:hypothetical protein ACI6Q2_02710 [Chitinophagaceae bacterium LWZ2-11]